MSGLAELLEQFRRGDSTLEETLAAVNGHFFQDLGHSTLDTDRLRRNGAAEVIYGEHKTPAQIRDLVTALGASGHNVLVTRTTSVVHDALTDALPEARYHEAARAITWVQTPVEAPETSVAVVSAGTSDLPVAAEAAVTAEFLGNHVRQINDVGVAGVHRLLSRIEDIRTARVVIVVAGMEGALPSVVGGLVDKPVIAVPTSVGYGAAFGGIAALLGMLNTCASGVSVVNIDNGFGAGYLASMINRL